MRISDWSSDVCSSDLPDLVKTYTYGPCASPGSKKTFGKPASITDPGGHTTNWTYAAAHGGVLTEMKTAPPSRAARSLTVPTFVLKYAHIKTRGSSLVLAIAPLLLPATMPSRPTTAVRTSSVFHTVWP